MSKDSEIERFTAQILLLKQQTVIDIIEIGRRLRKSKKLLMEQGEWEEWLKERVEISNVTATRIIEVADEYSILSELKDSHSSKLFDRFIMPGEQLLNNKASQQLPLQTIRVVEEAIPEHIKNETISELDKLQAENTLLKLYLEEAQEKVYQLKADVKEQETKLERFKKAQQTMKDKTKTDVTLLDPELVKKTESIAKAYDRAAKNLRSLNHTTEKHSRKN